MNRIGRFLVLAASGAIFTVSLILAPEANENGDFLPVTFGWILLFGLCGQTVFRFQRRVDRDKPNENKPNRTASYWGCRVFPALVCAAVFFSAFGAIGRVTPRFAVNIAWTIAVFPIAYFFFLWFGARPRCSATGERCVPAETAGVFRRTMLTVLLAAVMTESFFALFCYVVKDPALRAEYRANPDKMLVDNGMYFAPDSPERTLFENRLLESTEPLGTYGLTNTLAGVLVPVITLLTGIFFWNGAAFFSEPAERKKRLIRALCAAGSILPLAVVLLLTKSRAGYLACFAGTLLTFCAVAFLRFSNRRVFWTGAVAIPAVFIAAVLGAWGCGVLDKEVFTEAKRSLGFRLDYWEASCRMIAERPIFGVGAGNFQACYPHFMNPWASEVVADPHHFLFELAAVFGVPCALFFVAFLVALAVQAIRRPNHLAPPDQMVPVGVSSLAFFVGALGAFALSLSASAPVDFDFLLAAVPAGIIAVLLARIVFVEAIPAPILFAATAASLVNLSAAGGILFPAVGLPLCLFAAMIAAPEADESAAPEGKVSARSKQSKVCDGPQSSETTQKHPAFHFIINAGVILFFLFYLVGSDIAQNRSETALLKKIDTGAISRAEALAALQTVHATCRCDSLPIHQRLFVLSLAEYVESPTEPNKSEWERSKVFLRRAAPSSATVRFGAGKAELAAYEQIGRAELLESASRWFAEAVTRFPSNAEYHAYYGLTLRRLGKQSEASEEFRKALELDDAMPHKDRKLTPKIRNAVSR